MLAGRYCLGRTSVVVPSELVLTSELVVGTCMDVVGTPVDAVLVLDEVVSSAGRPTGGLKQDARARAKTRMRLIPAVCPLLFMRATL